MRFDIRDNAISFDLQNDALCFGLRDELLIFTASESQNSDFQVSDDIAGFAPDLTYSSGTSPIPAYTGTYTVIPRTVQQVLNTGGYRMTDNVTVEEIPYASVTNEKGGWTVTIGD